MAMQIRRTNGSGPPSGLAEGQLCVEMDTGNLWCGVPVTIDLSGRKRLNIQPDVSGYLPLAGGTLTPVVDGTLPAPGVGLSIDNDWTANAITINTKDYGYGLVAHATDGGIGIQANVDGPNSAGLQAINDAGSNAIVVLNRASALGDGIGAQNQAAGRAAINVNNTNATGTALRVDSLAGTAVDVVAGVVRVGVPTGTAVTGSGNINVSGGYYVNGVALGAGIAEPTTAGNFLRTDTGTWVAGLPLSGGTLAAITDANAATNLGLSVTTTRTAANASAVTVTNNGTGATASGIQVGNTNAGRAITVANSAGGSGVYVDQWGAASGSALFVTQRSGTTGTALTVNRTTDAYILNLYDSVGSNASMYAVAINTTSATGNAGGIDVNCSASAIASLRARGAPIIVGTPTGSAVTGAGNINVAGGYYVNGVLQVVPDLSGGTQYQVLTKGATAPGWADLAARPAFGTAAGTNAMALTTANYNTAFGNAALSTAAAGVNCTAVGALALRDCNVANCTAVGFSALMSNTTAENTAVGSQALRLNTTGVANTAVGFNALQANVGTWYNVAVGRGALQVLTGGGSNVAIGYNTMNASTNTQYNVAIGHSALSAAGIPGSYNVAIGYQAMLALTGQGGADGRTVAVGYGALVAQLTGRYNTAIGTQALTSATNSNNNTALGMQAGAFYGANVTQPATDITNSVFIGYLASPLNAAGDTNQIVIGHQATGHGSNTVSLGNASITAFYLGNKQLVFGAPDSASPGYRTVSIEN